MRKKACFILAFVLALTLCFSVTFAVESDNGSSTVSKEELSISVDVAREMALLFINDARELPDVSWDDQTTIVKTTLLYDEKENSAVSAYSFELNEGYIVVSAYLNTPTLILEWSDKAEPLYRHLDVTTDDRIVYVGSMYYYKDCGELGLESLGGEIVKREDVVNVLEAKSSYSNIPSSVLASIQNGTSRTAQTGKAIPGSDDVILDPFEHAEEWYNGPFKCNDYQNKWENYVDCHSTSDFKYLGDGYSNHCGPTAITNLIIMYGNMYDLASITFETADNIFLNVASIGLSKLPNPYYTFTDGTYNNTADNYIIDCFASYGFDVPVNGTFAINYSNVVTSLRNYRLMYVMMVGHECYGNHHVIGYAYTRLVSETDGSFVTYLKVADGWSHSPRYIDMASLDTDTYWEIE